MNKVKQHVTFKLSALLLALTLLAPTLVKFQHVFEDHKHEVCIDRTSTHLHEIEVECEFYKFKLNNLFTTFLVNEDSIFIEDFNQLNIDYYSFLQNHQKLHFSRRGPPQLV